MINYMELPEYMWVLDMIPFGEENAISRRSLVASTGYSDRLVRRMIARLRKSAAILSAESGGYYRPTENETVQIEKYIRRERKRAVSIFAEVTYAEKYLSDLKSGRISSEEGIGHEG